MNGIQFKELCSCAFGESTNEDLVSEMIEMTLESINEIWDKDCRVSDELSTRLRLWTVEHCLTLLTLAAT